MYTKAKILLFIAIALGIIGVSVPFAPRVWSISPPRAGAPVPITAFMKIRNSTSSREMVSLEDVSPFSICAVIKAEDRNFFRHSGFDWRQLRRAAGFAISGNAFMGGSTITQQLARNLFLSSDRSWRRKVQEALYTFWIERRFSKEEILTLYLNTAEWGENTWGITAAAEQYFAKSPRELSFFESVFLASLLPSPRASIRDRWESIEKISGRVSHQLYYSEYVSLNELKEIRPYLAALREQPLPISNPASVVSFPGGARYLTEECGLSTELRNTDRAKAGNPLETDPRYFAKSAFLSQNPNVAGISPDGKKILLKSMNAADFTLLVRERVTGKILLTDTQRGTQLSPTWSSDAKKIAYAYSEHSDQRFFVCILDVLTSTRRCSASSILGSAPVIRWSPDGKELAALSPSRHRVGKVLTVLSADTLLGGELSVSLSEKAGFDWSPDGKFFAVVPADRPGTIAVLDRDGAIVSQASAVKGECRSIHWGDVADTILATCRDETADYFGLFELFPDSKRSRKIAEFKSDILWPVRVGRDQIFFHVNSDSENKIFLKRAEAAPVRVGPAEGHNTFMGMAGDNSAYVLHVGRTRPAQLFSASLSRSEQTQIASTSWDSRLRVSSSESVTLNSSYGSRVPAYLWRSRVKGAGKAAVVLVHGGPHIQTPRYWNPAVQILTNAGADVLAINFRGSSGFGAHFEKHATLADQVADTKAGIEYLRAELGVPASAIYLAGHSYGTRVISELLRDPAFAETRVFLRGFLPRTALAASARVHLFQGAWDPLFPADRLIDEFRGSDARVMKLEREGHHFDKVNSQAEYFGEIVRAIREYVSQP